MQTDINAQMRAILIDWLVEVAEEYNLMQETMYICVSFSFHSQDTEQDTEVGRLIFGRMPAGQPDRSLPEQIRDATGPAAASWLRVHAVS